MSGDPLRDADRRDYRQSRAVSKYPKCRFCGCHIETEMIYVLDDFEFACEDCIQDRTRFLNDFMADREMDGDDYGLL